jgi:hypothetical protein
MDKKFLEELAEKIAFRHCDKISEQNPIAYEDCFPDSLKQRIINTFSKYLVDTKS